MVLGACGSGSAQTPTGTPRTNADGQQVYCHDEKPTGSNISREVCRPKEEVDAERNSAQDFMRQRNQSAAPSK